MNIHAFVLLVCIFTRYGCDSKKTNNKSSKLCQNMLSNVEKNSQSIARLEAIVAEQLKDLKEELSDKLDTLQTTTSTTMLKVTGNLALEKPATQSSITAGGTAGRATDGNQDGQYFHNSCSHTDVDANPWWSVDLGYQVFINKVVIKNRQDCCGERLHDLVLTVSKTIGGEEVLCGQYKGPSSNGATEIIRCATGVTGRFLKIQINAPEEYLTLCEVEVY